MGAAAAARTVARFKGKDVAEVLGRYTAPDEVIELPGSCHACGDACGTRMYRTEIPFFKASHRNLPLLMVLLVPDTLCKSSDLSCAGADAITCRSGVVCILSSHFHGFSS